MSTGVFTCAIDGGVALITIDQPPLNVLPFSGYEELCETIIHLVEAKQVKAVVLTGKGKAFVSGLDIREIGRIGSGDENTEKTMAIKGLFRRLEGLKRPVIAAINGNCFGGGLELAMSCHMRWASAEAKLGLLEINLGTIPSFGGTQRLTRIVGFPKALELMLTGALISGVDACRLGLVNQVWAPEELLSRTLSFAAEIAARSSRAVEAVIEAASGSLLESPTGEELESRLSSSLIGTADLKEGIAAFLERRSPIFTET